MAIETHDNIGGVYFSETRGGLYGVRLRSDRRFWIAWASTTEHETDVMRGVMDDFGNLTETAE